MNKTILLKRISFDNIRDGDFAQYKVYCPLCGYYCDHESDVQYEDYVGDNIWLECRNRCKVLFCGNEDNVGCRRLVDAHTAEAHGITLPKDYMDYEIYEIGVLGLTHVVRENSENSEDSEDSEDKEEYVKLPPGIISVYDIPDDICINECSTSYKGVCLSCGHTYESCIWTD